MKKIYQSPVLRVTPIRPMNMIALSIQVQENGGKGQVLIKEQNTKTYNIWDDDWNK